ncbi:aminoglycoside phosphotransferase family protein [Alkalihalobacillus sp. NPDC078783]
MTILNPSLLKKQILRVSHATSITPIHTGFSTDYKFMVRFELEPPLILRVGQSDSLQSRQQEANILLSLDQKGVICPSPVGSGYLASLDMTYQLNSYLEGEDAEIILPTLSDKEQYKIGYKAGEQLAHMHTLKAPHHIVAWENRAITKHETYLMHYKNLSKKVPNDEKLMDFITSNQHLLKGRPNYFQHDDFHLKNILIKDQQFAGTIDFNGYDWGDPYHDFVKISLFSRQTSIPFSIGQIHGYFQNHIPELFWTLYSVYTAMTVFSSVVWSIRVAPEQLDEMLGRLETVIQDHSSFKSVIPSWFCDAEPLFKINAEPSK